MHLGRTVLAIDCVLAGAEEQRARPLNSIVSPHSRYVEQTTQLGGSMRKSYWAVSILLLTQSPLTQAADVNVRVILSGEVAPGVYGRVDIGSSPAPPLVYAKPMVIVRQPSAEVQPIYLHVPPGHAKHWSKHCSKYNACGLPVYFVKSEEYEPKKPKKEKKEKPG